MSAMSIVIVMDRYALGGRETFVRVMARALMRHCGVTCHLVARKIHPRSDLSCFASALEAGEATPLDKATYALPLAMSCGNCAAVWVQHYGIADGVQLARGLGVPLWIMFHGSLGGMGQLTNEDLAAARDLRGLSVRWFAVSAEVAEQVRAHFGHEAVVIPNLVEIEPARASSSKTDGRVVVLSRSEKTGHLRACFDVFARLLEVQPDLRLEFCLADLDWLPRSTKSRSFTFRASTLLRLLGRKWFLANPARLRAIGRADIVAGDADAASAYRGASYALGMGRAALEALAHGVPTALVGYQHPVGVFTRQTFDAFAWSNFSGRGLERSDARSVACALSVLASDESSALRLRVDIAVGWSDVGAKLGLVGVDTAASKI